MRSRTYPAPARENATGNRSGAAPLSDDVDDADALTAIEATYARDTTDDQVIVIDGYGAVVRVDRAHLTISDGLGPYRRTRRYAKATHGIRRLVVLAHAGVLSIDSLRWCHQLGIELAVLDGDANVTFTSVPASTDDARLRRTQALAVGTPLGHAIALELLNAKLRGHARLLRARFDEYAIADDVDALADDMQHTNTTDQLRALESQAAGLYWACWSNRPETSPEFVARDRARVPSHFLAFDTRRSVLASANGNRRAERPTNAICNYLTSVAEVEASIAAQRVGLDLGFAFVHACAGGGRPNFSLDLLEVARPAIEFHVLDLLADRTFKRNDFVELDDGHVRVLPPLSHELARTMPRWAKIIGPYAERVAHMLGDHLDGAFTPTTPLTGRNLQQAQARVKARKANAGAPSTRRQRPTDSPEQPTATCVSCGAPVERKRHLRCPTCWATQPGQDEQTRRKRGQAIAARRAELEQWNSEHPDARNDPEAFRREILPGLQHVTLAQIMDATGMAKSSASMVRSGTRVPALRHWAALEALTQAREASASSMALPETLSDYDGHLIVISDARPGTRSTSLGERDTREARVDVHLRGGWKSIGEIPIFFRTVQNQIDEAGGEPLGGRLVKGTELNADEWAIQPVTGDDEELLNTWSEDAAESF
jgi:CRISPR/Cas system-associated endonuclease Cas1